MNGLTFEFNILIKPFEFFRWIYKNMLTNQLKICKLNKDGRLAQLGEHLFDVQKVIGSIPIAPTIIFNKMGLNPFFINKEQYPSGLRDWSWKPAEVERPARVRISFAPPCWKHRFDTKKINGFKPFFVA